MAHNTPKKKRRLKKEVVTLLTGIFLVLLVVTCIIIFKSADRFNYEESLSANIISISNNTVSGCEVMIPLSEVAYYIVQVEEDGQRAALLYNSKNPLAYWNLYLNQDMTENSGYISDIAKRSVITFCVRDNVYNMEARLNGFTLSDEEEADIDFDAELAYTHLSLDVRKRAGFDVEEFKRYYRKEQIAHAYMLYLASNDEDEDSVLDAIVLKYDVGGSYYEGLLNNYPYTVNEKIWENIRIGHMTVNK